METELEILFRNHFLSRKDYRRLRGLRLRSLSELEEHLKANSIIEGPDWKEALFLLKNPELEGRDWEKAPESKNLRMQEIERTALRVANSDTTLLLLGESGVGKSRLAGLVHTHSHRRSGPFVTVSCGSIPDTLLESELFGVEKGAYTGATKSREGRFERANGGTLFLDEIGELGAPLQVKLLRVIQEKKIEPLGSSKEIEVDVRLIAATNRNLEAEVESGHFRKDLYFRLNVVPLTLPSLRERPEDILPLSEFFLRKFSRQMGQSFFFSDDGLKEALLAYDWPGNIRELENSIERLCVLADPEGGLHARDLPPRLHQALASSPSKAQTQSARGGPDSFVSAHRKALPTLAEAERQLIEEALKQSDGILKEAARLLGIHRNTLTRKIREYGLSAKGHP